MSDARPVEVQVRERRLISTIPGDEAAWPWARNCRSWHPGMTAPIMSAGDSERMAGVSRRLFVITHVLADYGGASY